MLISGTIKKYNKKYRSLLVQKWIFRSCMSICHARTEKSSFLYW